VVALFLAGQGESDYSTARRFGKLGGATGQGFARSWRDFSFCGKGRLVRSHFGDRLCEAVRRKSTSLIVGLDPVYGRLPGVVRNEAQGDSGADVRELVRAVQEFCSGVLRVVAPLVAAVKINIAYFEQYLWQGLKVFYEVIREANGLGLQVIADVKRGDIGHTAEAYARAYLGGPEFIRAEHVVTADAITVNAFAGSEGLLPFADVANEQGKGVFVWVRASNPSAARLQDFTSSEGLRWCERLAEVVAEVANEPQRIGASGYSNVGMVVGATAPEEVSAIRSRYPKLWLLVPGFGAQGASARDCARFMGADGMGALINASRSIIYSYQQAKYAERFGDDWQKCIEQAVIDAKMELANAIQTLI
jgi:orotidine-5'-phosphate decarboxylase